MNLPDVKNLPNGRAPSVVFPAGGAPVRLVAANGYRREKNESMQLSAAATAVCLLCEAQRGVWHLTAETFASYEVPIFDSLIQSLVLASSSP